MQSSLKSLNPFVSFKYIPLNHINATDGSYLCDGLDCPSTQFDACLTKEYCWFEDTCSPRNQQAVSEYLHCFEGPFANRESPTNASRRPHCMQQAGLDYDRVLSCTADKPKLASILSALNATRAPMYSSLGPSPGMFPHIFIDGAHLFNNSWASLTRLLCARLPAQQLPDACTDRVIEEQFRVHNLSAQAINSDKQHFLTAVQLAADLALSKVAFPVHFEYADWPHNADPDPNGAPSYVNAQAITRVQLINVQAVEQSVVAVKVKFEVLGAFEAYLLKRVLGAV